MRRNLIASEHVKIALRVTNAGSKRETGWHAEGNIYRDEPLASIAKDYPPQTTEPVYELKIDSGSTSRMSTLP